MESSQNKNVAHPHPHFSCIFIRDRVWILFAAIFFSPCLQSHTKCIRNVCSTIAISVQSLPVLNDARVRYHVTQYGITLYGYKIARAIDFIYDWVCASVSECEGASASKPDPSVIPLPRWSERWSKNLILKTYVVRRTYRRCRSGARMISHPNEIFTFLFSSTSGARKK